MSCTFIAQLLVVKSSSCIIAIDTCSLTKRTHFSRVSKQFIIMLPQCTIAVARRISACVVMVFFGYIHWDGSFSMLGPTDEKACISYYSDECSVLDDKEICYSFNYHQSKRWRGVRTKKSSPLMTCNVTVDGQVCSQCDVCCDGRHTDQGIHYTVANCTNVPGMESLDYQCQDAVDTVKDIRG